MSEQNSLHNFMFTGYKILEILTKLDMIELISKYICFQIEICPKTGRAHIQGYCELKKKTRFNTIHKLFCQCNLQPRYGTQEEAINYVKKDKTRYLDDCYEYGEPRKQGERIDLKKSYDNYINGQPVENLNHLIMYGNRFDTLQKKSIPVRIDLPESHLILYDSKKTSKIDIYRYVFDTIAQEKETFMWEEDTEFNGYIGQRYLLSPVMSNWEILISKYPYQVK